MAEQLVVTRPVATPGPSNRSAVAGAAAQPHFLHVFSTFGHGGVAIRMASIINQFGDRFRHTIVALDNCYATANRVDPELAVAYADAPFPRSGLGHTIARARRFVGAAGADVLLTYNWGAIEWAFAQLIAPQCSHVHLESGFGPEEVTGQIRRRAQFRRLALARAAHVIVPSFTLVDIARDSWRLRRNQVVHIPNGVDCEAFARAPAPGLVRGFTKQPGEAIVGTVAPLRGEKNVARLLRAFADVPDDIRARLLIVGDGPERPALTVLAAELGITERTVFAGHVERVAEVIGLFDVFALSSDTEQMPNCILQAMAAGRPIAAVDVGDVRRLLPRESQDFVVPAGSHEALATAIAQLLRDDHLRARLGSANRDHVGAHYRNERMFDAYGAVFDRVLSTARRAPSFANERVST